MASGTDSGQRPRRLHLHTQRAPHKPCRIFAIEKTTWLRSSLRRYFRDAAKALFCLHSSLIASPSACQIDRTVARRSFGMIMAHLASLGIVSSIDPPLFPHFQLVLEVQQQISTWHSSSCEEVCAHPTLFEVVWSRPMGEDMYEQFPSWCQCLCDLGHQ